MFWMARIQCHLNKHLQQHLPRATTFLERQIPLVFFFVSLLGQLYKDFFSKPTTYYNKYISVFPKVCAPQMLHCFPYHRIWDKCCTRVLKEDMCQTSTVSRGPLLRVVTITCWSVFFNTHVQSSL